MNAYVQPRSVTEACAHLAARTFLVLAGGTDVFPAEATRRNDLPILDISTLPGLRGVRDEGVGYRIGALTTWTDLASSSLPHYFDGLKLAAREVGGVQIQNAGTIAGNLCNASPAADGVPALLTLDARVELTTVAGVRTLALADFLLGPRRTARESHELVTAILIPKPRHDARGHFVKLGARRYLLISIAMVAGVLEIDGARVATARIAIGACSPVAQRLPALELRLAGMSVDAGLADAVQDKDFSSLTPVDDVRASAAYRRSAAQTLTRRLLRTLGTNA